MKECVHLETEIGQELLNLACCHHVTEIMLEKAFGLSDVSVSKYEDISPFSRLTLTRPLSLTIMDDMTTATVIVTWIVCIVCFAVEQLEKFQPRDDLQELLELTIMFIGGMPQHGVHFRYLGAIHARVIYFIKMWLFSNEYSLQQHSVFSWVISLQASL